MNDHHRAETNRFLYFARLQLDLATNRELQQQQQLPDVVQEQLYYRAALHFIELAYRHYLLEIAELTQCKITAHRAAPMLFAWQQDGWFSDQLTELEKLESSASWLSELLITIDKSQPVLQTAASVAVKVDSNDTELIAVTVLDDDKKTPHQQLVVWHDELSQLISRQRQLAQNW